MAHVLSWFSSGSLSRPLAAMVPSNNRSHPSLVDIINKESALSNTLSNPGV